MPTMDYGYGEEYVAQEARKYAENPKHRANRHARRHTAQHARPRGRAHIPNWVMAIFWRLVATVLLGLAVIVIYHFWLLTKGVHTG